MIPKKLQDEFEKPLVKYGLLATLLLVLAQYVVIPWLEWRSEKQSELSARAERVVSEDELARASQSLQEKSQQLESDLKLAESLFITELANPRVNLPAVVREAAENDDVRITRISVNELQLQREDLSAFMVSLEGEASIDRIMAFVKHLESNSSFFFVDRLTIYDVKASSAKLRMELVKYVSN